MVSLALFIVIAELVNLGWMFISKTVKAVNIWQVVVIIQCALISVSVKGSCPVGAVFFGILLLYYMLGIWLENHDNVFNFNELSSVLFGAYMMAALVIALLHVPCSNIGDCLWHDWVLQIQGMYY